MFQILAIFAEILANISFWLSCKTKEVSVEPHQGLRSRARWDSNLRFWPRLWYFTLHNVLLFKWVQKDFPNLINWLTVCYLLLSRKPQKILHILFYSIFNVWMWKFHALTTEPIELPPSFKSKKKKTISLSCTVALYHHMRWFLLEIRFSIF